MSSFFDILKQTRMVAAPSEIGIIDFVLEHPDVAMNLKVTELAEKSHASTAAIVRLCKRLNLKGYSDLKLKISKDVFSNSEPSDTDILKQFDHMELPSSELIPRFIDLTNNGLNQLKLVLDDKEIDKAVNLICESENIVLFGIGASGIVALDLQYKLSRLGMNVMYSQDAELQIVQACSSCSKRLAFAISYSGETESVLKAAKVAKMNDTTLISLTKIGGNHLDRLADIHLHVPISENMFRQGAVLSMLNQLVVIDILFSCILQRTGSKGKSVLLESWDNVSKTKYELDPKDRP